MDVLDFFNRYKDFIIKGDILSWLISYPKWWLTMGLYKFCSMSEGLIDTAFKVFTFLESTEVFKIYKGFQYVSWSVLALTLAYIGLKMIFGKKVKFKDTVLHLVIMACLIVNLPSLMSSALTFNQKLYGESKSVLVNGNTNNEGENSLAFNIIRTNVADLEYLAKEGYNKLDDKNSVKNMLTEDNLDYADFHQILTPDDISKISKESGNKDALHLQNYVTLNGKGEVKAEKIKNGWFNIFNDGTFRYGARFGVMNVSFIVLAVFYFMQFCKLIIILVDLVQMKLYAPLVLASDIETGQKTKQMMLDIFGSVFTISALGISTILYSAFYRFLLDLNLNVIAFLFIGVLGGVGFVKGSDSVAKYFGINTSVKEGVIGAMAGIGALKAGQMATQGASAVADKVGKVADTGKKSFQKASEGMQNGVKNFGEMAGHISERGVGGYAKDMAEKAGDSVKEKAGEVGNKITEPFKNAKENLSEGMDKGRTEGQNVNSREDSKAKTDDIAKNSGASTTNIDGQSAGLTNTESPSNSNGYGSSETEADIAKPTIEDEQSIQSSDSLPSSIESLEKDQGAKSQKDHSSSDNYSDSDMKNSIPRNVDELHPTKTSNNKVVDGHQNEQGSSSQKGSSVVDGYSNSGVDNTNQRNLSELQSAETSSSRGTDGTPIETAPQRPSQQAKTSQSSSISQPKTKQSTQIKNSTINYKVNKSATTKPNKYEDYFNKR